VSLFEETQDRAEELAVLNDMARAFTQTLDIDAVAEITYRYCKRLLGVDNFYMALYDAGEDTVDYRLFMRSGQKIHLDNPKQTGDKGITRWVIQNRKPLHLQNDIDSWIAEEDLQPQGQRAESYLGLPMMKGNQVIGMIAVQSYTTPRQFDSHDLDLLSGVAGQAATAIENAQLFGQTQARARREQILREITAKVHSSADADAILKTAVEEVSNALGRQAFVQLGSKEDKQPHGQLKPALQKSPSDSNPVEDSKPEPTEFPDLPQESSAD
jgi:GAF domain-containing protein